MSATLSRKILHSQGKTEQERDKYGEKGKARAREREKRKKEGLKQNTIQHLGNPGKVQREFIPRKPSLKEILITSNP